MRRALRSTDDQLLARLRSAPNLSDGIESLSYWHDRRRRLSWYRIRARREAASMILRWEDRVREAMFSRTAVPITARLSAGRLLARTHLQRWRRRAAIGVTVIAGGTVLVAPVVVAVLLLIRVV
ncbi:MAG TPA: hypothetical protein VGH93_09695 [Solirubrobacteraceae bacterium]|jgi:hypothetical protein